MIETANNGLLRSRFACRRAQGRYQENKMKKIFLLTIFTTMLIFANTAYASFSQFIRITPETEKKHNIQVQIKPISNQKNKYRITIPFSSDSQQAWLIICKKPVVPEKQEFRNYIWSFCTDDDENRDIIVSACLRENKNNLIPPDSGTSNNIEIILDEESIRKAYIYIDFPMLVLDGGYYYTIDLSSYLDQKNKN